MVPWIQSLLTSAKVSPNCDWALY